ncbi:long-chain fatty acid--CoA ligase [Jiangella anatolica]|nr:long-chain fatty acid--CoA ligase [Jiangella anatolica]
MQDVPLTTTLILERGERFFGTRTATTRTASGLERTTYAALAAEARRIAGALDQLGVSPDGRVATFAWNTARHVALYFAIPGTGRVLHTGNIRYFPDQLIYTFEHAEDEVAFVDRSLMGLFGQHLPKLNTLKHVVVMDDGAPTELPDDPRIVHYADLVAGADEYDLHDRIADENTAAAICYTSGTTGHPKGVVYSHRSAWLHSVGGLTTGAFALTDADRVLPVVPMFHANAWGLPYAALMAGASLVLPGPDLSPGGLLELMASERVTVAAGVPTIWMGMVPLLDQHDLTSLRTVICGGSAVPRSLSEAWRDKIGLPITQAWGMTEMSPLGTFFALRAEVADLSQDDEADLRTTVGIAPPGVATRIVDPETRQEVPWDGESVGELECRGPWLARQYYRTDEPGEQFTPDGWLRTGDVATISPLGYVRLVDRTKDLVKSGGEWISSVELENEIMGHPSVAEAAVIAAPHEKWGERPLACVVLRAGEAATAEEIRGFLRGRVTAWKVPDEVVFLDAIPKTSVGKFSKRALRDQLLAGR